MRFISAFGFIDFLKKPGTQYPVDLKNRTSNRIGYVVNFHCAPVLLREVMTDLSRAGRSAQKSVFVCVCLRLIVLTANSPHGYVANEHHLQIPENQLLDQIASATHNRELPPTGWCHDPPHFGTAGPG